MSKEEEKKNEETTNGSSTEQDVKAEVPQNEEQTADAAQQIEELNKKYLLLYAEYDNYRKRTARERSELLKSAGSDVIKSILPMIDDLERAIKANENATDLETVKEGFRLIHNKFMHSMLTKGVKPMELIGKDFDADLSEAIANMPVEDEKLKGKVIDVVENGYLMNDTVIRFAKVVVGQ